MQIRIKNVNTGEIKLVDIKGREFTYRHHRFVLHTVNGKFQVGEVTTGMAIPFDIYERSESEIETLISFLGGIDAYNWDMVTRVIEENREV